MSHEVLHVEDSFAEMKNIPDGTFDHVITDPPYNVHVQENMISGTAMKKHVQSGKGAIPRVKPKFAALEDYSFANDLIRAAKHWAMCFSSVEDFGEYRRAVKLERKTKRKSEKPYRQWVRGGIWYKPNAQGQMTGDRPAACYEGISIMHRDTQKIWNGHGSYGLWVCNGTRGQKGRHPNQKPLELCLKLVALFTKRGDTVFDPFCGSGRIGEACVRLGRNYVGFDNDLDWVIRAIELLDECSEDWTDEEALKLCTAKKADILDTEDDYDYSAVDSD